MINIPETQKELDGLTSDLAIQKYTEISETTVRKIRDDLEFYFWQCNIKDVYIGVSGGIDSAVALQLLDPCSVKVHPYCITFNAFKKFNSQQYIDDLQELRIKSNLSKIVSFDLSRTLDTYMAQLFYPQHANADISDFQIEQTSYSLRYNALFSMASSTGGITVGTTNKDELSYTGWFGKHSDMNVDIQFLWKYNKIQIRHLAELLNVPQSIILRDPSGDLPDGSTDEQNFGCTYDELTWYAEVGREMPHSMFMQEKFRKLNELHLKNSHKYNTKELTHYNPIFL